MSDGPIEFSGAFDTSLLAKIPVGFGAMYVGAMEFAVLVRDKLAEEVYSNVSATCHSLADLRRLGHPYSEANFHGNSGAIALHPEKWYQVHQQSGKLVGAVRVGINLGIGVHTVYSFIDTSSFSNPLIPTYIHEGTGKMVGRPFMEYARRTTYHHIPIIRRKIWDEITLMTNFYTVLRQANRLSKFFPGCFPFLDKLFSYARSYETARMTIGGGAIGLSQRMINTFMLKPIGRLNIGGNGAIEKMAAANVNRFLIYPNIAAPFEETVRRATSGLTGKSMGRRRGRRK